MLVNHAVRVVAAGCVLSVGAVFTSAGGALAQTASQITPPTFAPLGGRSEAPIAIPESSSDAAPAGADELSVTLGDVVVEGGDVDPVQMAELRRRLTGQPVSVASIFATARELEISYARAGYPLRRVIVPAQQIVDGSTLRLSVVDGFIERVDVSSLPKAVQRRVAATLAPLMGRQGLTIRALERRLLLASDTPGVSMRSTLAAGSTAGATILVVEADYRAVTGYGSLDNNLTRSLGRVSASVGVNLNSVLGLGEGIYLGASGLPSTDGSTGFFEETARNRALAAGLTLPIGYDGLELNVEASDTRSTPRNDAGMPRFSSQFTRYAGRVSYPFIRTRALSVVGQLGLDAQEERVNIVSPEELPISFDRQRVLRGSAEVLSYIPGDGHLKLRLEGSVGLDALGARSAADASPLLPLSREGADASFRKLRVDGVLEQPLMSQVTMAVTGKAQTSFGDPLSNAEQFGVASADAISALPSGSLVGDKGYSLRTELRFPFGAVTDTNVAWLTPYAFGTRAGVWLENPSVFERSRTSAYTYGAGARFTSVAPDGSPGVSLSVEYGRAHVSGTRDESNRISLSLVGQF